MSDIREVVGHANTGNTAQNVQNSTIKGSGIPSYRFEPTSGIIRRFVSPQDVIASIDEDVESTIALVNSGGTTFLSPILGRLAGIIACDGTLRSHLAIVSREFEVPCLVGSTVDSDLVDGTMVRLECVDGDQATVTIEQPEGTEEVPVPVHLKVDVATEVERWWQYVRRIGNEIAVKDFDVVMSDEVLDALISEPLTDQHLDDLVQHMGRTFNPR